MKPLLILTLLIAPVVVTFGDPESDKFDLRFPTKDHLTALQVYQAGNTAKAIHKTIGQFVLLDVVVTIERDVPLVEIVIPKDLAGDSAHPSNVIQAHLISATTVASSRKKGERLRIEGIIVAEGYGAYTIYLHHARLIK
jgi:hypothetical protein